MMHKESDLMYTCSLVEYIGRERKLRRCDVASALGKRGISLILNHASVLHSESIASVADEYVRIFSIGEGTFDNISACHYEAPDYWTIGEVFARLVEDSGAGDPVQAILDIFASWISDAISNYNSDLFYQPRDYLRECYLNGEVIAA